MRYERRLESGGRLRIDTLGSALCAFVRIAGPESKLVLIARGAYLVEQCPAGGWLARSTVAGRAYWLPQVPFSRTVGDQGHILAETHHAPEAVLIGSEGISVTLATPRDRVVDLIVWQLPNEVAGELAQLSPIEKQRYFLWGSHTTYERPADLYLHLIFGHIYENRFSWPKYRRICSENDAHALYVLLRGLSAATGKRIYDLMMQQVLLSVLSRQGDDGGFHHGEWTEVMEAHFRLHCSAMHLLMDALAEHPDPMVRNALERAAAFLARQIDQLDPGVWFLHDELEHSVESMREGPFRWLLSRAFGKSEANMLVLNSHLDTTIALDRYAELTGDPQYRSLIVQANVATRRVLSQRPAELLYRVMFRAIRLTFLPTAAARQLPPHHRALKRIAWRYLIPLLPRLKARFPRLVMPGGYVDRELSLRIFAHEYMPINLMDLLRFKRRFPDEPVDGVILAGLELVHESRLFERWLEIKGREYAVGFWAEALYHACLLYTEPKFRSWLGEAALLLEARGMGLPSSLLGANAEAVPPTDQTPTPLVDDAAIRVVNLCRAGVLEFLLVNCKDRAARVRFLRNEPGSLIWSVGTDGDSAVNTELEVPPVAFLWGRPADHPALPS